MLFAISSPTRVSTDQLQSKAYDNYGDVLKWCVEALISKTRLHISVLYVSLGLGETVVEL